MTIVEDLIEDFTGLDEREACQELDELGREIPEIPDSVKIDENFGIRLTEVLDSGVASADGQA